MPWTNTVLPSSLIAIVLITLVGCGSGADSLEERQQAVAEIGTEVMPFDLDATTHIFTDTATGGVQNVVADDPADEANVASIRLHLEEEAAKFEVGDFSDPEAIHGAAMPGLSTLKERFDEITVELTETEIGATITYRTDDADVVQAIHDWFAAQSSDHGNHAEHSSS